MDTRNTPGTVGGPRLTCGIFRAFPIAGYCDIPAGATAISLNVAVTNPTANGSVVLYPARITPPATTPINYGAGLARANNAVVLLNEGQFETLCRSFGTTDLIIE